MGMMVTMTEDDVTTYADVEVPKTMTLTEGTKKALEAYKANGYVAIERDDGPEGYETFEQLEQIAGSVGINHGKTDTYTLVLWGSTIMSYPN